MTRADLLCVGACAIVTFIRIDEIYSKRWAGRMDLAHRVAHIAMALGAPIGVGIVGFFLFRGIWPEGVAFHLGT